MSTTTPSTSSAVPASPPPVSPWLDVNEAAQYARCGVKTLYKEIARGRLRAARIGGRREIRVLREWLDTWLLASTGSIGGADGD